MIRRGDYGICAHIFLRILGFGRGSRAKYSNVTDVTAPKPPTWRLIVVPGSYCCSVVTVQRFNTVQRLTLRCSSGGAPSATRARSDEARGRQSPRPTATPTRHSHTTRHSAIRQSESPSASRAHTPQPAGAAPAAPRRARRPKAWDGFRHGVRWVKWSINLACLGCRVQ